MKSYEKEIINAGIQSEKWVIRQLQNLYKDSIGRITNEIEFLYDRYRNEGRQSVIYQIDYQKAIGRQIKAHLELLQEKEYETISEYLEDCYKGGYIGTMYSLQKQGIPLITPMNQEQVINAIVHESKLSKGLYESLGVDVNQLKNKIRVEVSRGIANNYTFADVARNLENNSKIGMSNAMRIARTEGHRIREQSSMDAANKAKEKGADVVKQWCSILDSKTRNTHALLDGQIRELDEPFEVNGLKAMCPGQFGRASEDINCRCTLLQRAKWALDKEELQILEDRAKAYGLDKTKDFEDYKKKYLKAVDEESKIEAIKDELPKYDSYDIDKITSKYKGNDKLVKGAFANAVMDDETLIILNNLDKLENVEIKRGKKSHWTPGFNELILSDSTTNSFYHEFGHSLDNLTAYYNDYGSLGSKYKWISEDIDDIRKQIAKEFNGYIPEDFISIMESENKRLMDTIKKEYIENGKVYEEIKDILKKKYDTNILSKMSPYQYKLVTNDLVQKQIQKYIKEFQKKDPTFNKWGCLSDIFDAITSGSARNANKLTQKHGWDYYVQQSMVTLSNAGRSSKENAEILANFVEMKLGGYDEQLNYLRSSQPRLYEALNNCYKKIASILGGSR